MCGGDDEAEDDDDDDGVDDFGHSFGRLQIRQ